jgi:hypothetical protein
MSPKGNKWASTHSQRSICAKAGSPTRPEAQGDGILRVLEEEQGRFFLKEGAALQRGLERVLDTDTQEREQEYPDWKGMRNAGNRILLRNSS